MTVGHYNGFLRQLRGVMLARETNSLSDAQLLDGFFLRRDEAAFEALVRRHGPMVLGVCRRVLCDLGDAEDAFQATFLVLVRKAATLRNPDQVSNWLYGVAYRTAIRARSQRAQRQAFERPLFDLAAPEPIAELVWQELRPIVDEELNRLPERYRAPLVLCYLEGKTKRQAARHLGRPEGTVSTQLARGRELLRRRLTHRGLSLSASVIAAALSHETASAAVSGSLLTSTVQAAVQSAAGKAAAAGVISLPVAVLTEGVLRAMFLTKLKIVVVTVLAVGLIAGSAGGLVYQGRADASPTDSAIALGQQRRGEAPRDEADNRGQDAQSKAEDLIKAAEANVKQAEAMLQAAEARRKQAQATLENLRARQRDDKWLDPRQAKSLHDIERALKDLKDNTADDKNRSQAVGDFERAFRRLKDRLEGKEGMRGGGGGGPGNSSSEKVFDPNVSQGANSSFGKSGTGFSGGGGFAGFSGGNFSSSASQGKNPFGSGGLGGFNSMGGSSNTKDPATEKQLHDALERIRELEIRLEKYEKKSKSESKGEEENLPAQNVRGAVRAVSKDGLVEISIGSDDGLQPGHTLEVYRLKPSPRYLGRIKILDVKSTQSVAQPLAQTVRSPMQEGDHVTSSLIQ